MDFNLQHKYRRSQINGTIYVTTCQTLATEQLAELESGAGELFLTRIHKRSTPDHIMQVAIELGDVYMLRFKIDFSGCSRGYAYLQYIDAQHKALALEILQHRFRVARLKVQVRESRNRKTLVLNNVNHLTPLQVHQELRLVGNYIKLCVYEYQPQRYIYLILYRNNDEAAMAHHMLRTRMSNFGANAFIDWLDKGQPQEVKDQPVDPLPIDCCVQLPRNGHTLDLDQLQNVAECVCFRI
ncbi:uncharacterized protein tut [Drosophila montana]|uniref:uncharacterized protein tut n=1 Tax=Drosophila montana TaxID=40370 RepID=UPI00313B6DD9